MENRAGEAGLAEAFDQAIEQLPVTGWQRGILHIFLAQRPHRPTANR